MPWKPPRNHPIKPSAPRPTANKRGLDRRHRKMREQELKEQPLCVYCLQEGRVTAATQIDHVVPLTRGGSALDPNNRVPSCRDCNLAKGAKLKGSAVLTDQEIEAAEASGVPPLGSSYPQGGGEV